MSDALLSGDADGAEDAADDDDDEDDDDDATLAPAFLILLLRLGVRANVGDERGCVCVERDGGAAAGGEGAGER